MGEGAAVQRLYHLGRAYTAWIRVGTFVPIAVIGGLGATAATAWPTAAVLTTVAASSAFYLLVLRRRWRAHLVAVDAAALVVLALSTRWTIPPDWLAEGKSWLVPFITFACVAYQYHLGRMFGAVLAVVVHAALVVGTVWALPEQAPVFGLVSACWSLVVSVLARILWTLVRRGGRMADDAMAAAERIRTERRVAAELRSDERALTNALHDTAATTLLLVGSGQIGRGSEAEAILSNQARQDLDVLRAFGRQPPERMDLCSALATALPASVAVSCPAGVPLPGRVTRAVVDAIGEAVRNATRHAHADRIEVEVTSGPGGFHAVVRDDGVGFDPERVPAPKRGVRESIVGRMAAVGGAVAIESGTTGTSVRLRWPA
ncbi:ATP-binding protein [Actinokineospora sp. NBRC 105648]|uniref:sensor histidine kinase n=1 Tax=Actinokineospora sp. NBRC 105648 TaxID=3032206 RepID=UPI0024A2B3DD|nr:ATP-binding protein [Actinokineospora sp. NBRC 105648]GLZ38137.1 ATP-binding protein [Actinokineospora sp. NBRC 105648]